MGTGQGQLLPASGPGSPGKELHSDLHMAATCAGLGGPAWERLCCELRLAAAITDLSPIFRLSVGTTLGAEASHHLCWTCGHLVEAVFQANTGYSICQAWGYLMGITVQVEIGHCLCQVCSCLARGARHAKASHCSFGFVDL